MNNASLKFEVTTFIKDDKDLTTMCGHAFDTLMLLVKSVAAEVPSLTVGRVQLIENVFLWHSTITGAQMGTKRTTHPCIQTAMVSGWIAYIDHTADFDKLRDTTIAAFDSLPLDPQLRYNYTLTEVKDQFPKGMSLKHAGPAVTDLSLTDIEIISKGGAHW